MGCFPRRVKCATFVEPSLQDAGELAKESTYTVYTGEKRSGQQAYIGFTAKIPPLNDPRVRRAIGFALDRNAMVDIGFNGLVQATQCPVAPGLLGYDPEKCEKWGTSYDPKNAEQLLKEAGYGPGHPLDLVLSVSPLQGADESNVVMQQQLAAVGIRVKIETRQFATWVDYMSKKNRETTGVPEIWTMLLVVRSLRPSLFCQSVWPLTLIVHWRPWGPCTMNDCPVASTLTTAVSNSSM